MFPLCPPESGGARLYHCRASGGSGLPCGRVPAWRRPRHRL